MHMKVESDKKKNKKKISNKQLILKTAYGLFLKKGYKSVSIKDIMEASNLSKGGVYHHFKGKEEILFEVLDQYFFKALDINRAIFCGITFKERIKKMYLLGVSLFEMVESLGESGVKYPINSLYLFQLECESFPKIRKQFRETSVAYRTLIKNIVTEGIQNKEVKKDIDPEIISYQIIGMIEGIAIHQSTVKDNVGAILLQKYESVFNSYFNFICLDNINIGEK